MASLYYTSPFAKCTTRLSQAYHVESYQGGNGPNGGHNEQNEDSPHHNPAPAFDTLPISLRPKNLNNPPKEEQQRQGKHDWYKRVDNISYGPQDALNGSKTLRLCREGPKQKNKMQRIHVNCFVPIPVVGVRLCPDQTNRKKRKPRCPRQTSSQIERLSPTSLDPCRPVWPSRLQRQPI